MTQKCMPTLTQGDIGQAKGDSPRAGKEPMSNRSFRREKGGESPGGGPGDKRNLCVGLPNERWCQLQELVKPRSLIHQLRESQRMM